MEITKTHYRNDTEMLSTLLRQISWSLGWENTHHWREKMYIRLQRPSLCTPDKAKLQSKMREIENNLNELMGKEECVWN